MTRKAQAVARSIALRLKKACKNEVKCGGVAIKG